MDLYKSTVLENKYPGIARKARATFASVIWEDPDRGVWKGGILRRSRNLVKQLDVNFLWQCEYAIHNDVIRNLSKWIDTEGVNMLIKEREDG